MALAWERVEFTGRDDEDLEATVLFDGSDGPLAVNPRETPSSGTLYDVRTVCTITPSSQDQLPSDGIDATSAPSIHSAVSEDGLRLSVVVGRTVITLAASGRELKTTTRFESDVECLSLSKDGDFLLAGCTGGLLNVIYIPQNKCLLSQKLLRNADDFSAVTFSNVTFSPTDQLGGVCSILLFTDEGTVFVFNNIRLNHLANAVITNSSVEMRENLLAIEESQFYLNCVNGNVVSNFGKDVHLLTVGEWVYLLSLPELSTKYELFNESSNGKLVKVKVLIGGRFAILLDDAYCLHVLCLRTFVIVKQWRALKIVDFNLRETVDKKSSVCLDVKLVLLVASECGGRLLQLHDFPSFNLLYTTKVASFSALLEIPANQDSILFLEGVVDDKNCICKLNVREISEAMPEARLCQLLNKRKFDEALHFATCFGLDQEVVYRVKVNYLSDQLLLWRDAHQPTMEINNVKREIVACLDQINDVDTVFHCCVGASLHTLQDTAEMLLYAMNKLKTMKSVDGKLKDQVSMTLEKLETFEAIFGADQFRNGWRMFQEADLLSELLRCVDQGKLNAASMLWDRNQHRLAQAMTVDQVLTILKSGAIAGYSSAFCNWVKLSFAPSVLRNIPNCLEVVIAWTVRHCCTMEVVQKKDWPGNAIRFAEDMDSIFRAFCSKTTLGLVELQAELKKDRLASEQSVGSQMQTLLGNLKSLNKLRSIYGCMISLADFSHNDKREVCCCLLKRIDTLTEIPKFVTHFLKPYVRQHDLNIDEILHYYVMNVMEEYTAFDGWLGEAAPWEQQIIAVIDCISDVDYRLESVVRTLNFALVPWSLQIEELAKRSLDFSHDLVSEVKKQMDRVVSKVILMKYGLQMYNIDNSNLTWAIINRIIRQDGEDATEDALTIAKFSQNFSSLDAYSCRLRHLVSSDKYSEFVALLKSLPIKMAIACCERLAFHFNELLRDDGWNATTNNEKILYVRAAVHVLSRLKSHINPFDFQEHSSLLDLFTRMYALQTEFHAFLTLQELSSAARCLEIFYENAESVLHHGRLSESFECCTFPNVAERRTGSSQTRIPRLYRLSAILQLKRETALTVLATVAFRKGHIDVFFDVLIEMSNGSICADGAAVLFDSVLRFVSQFDGKSFSMEPKHLEKLLNLLGMVLSRVSVYCDPGLLERCIELSHFVTVLRKLGYQSPQNELKSADSECVSVLEVVDPYKQWVFTSIYSTCGLPVDTQLVLSGVSALVKHLLLDWANNKESSNILTLAMETAHNLNCHLYEKRHTSLAYFLLNCFASILIKHGFQKEVLFLIDKVSNLKRKLTVDMLSAMFSQRQMDKTMILGLLLSLPNQDAIQGLETMEKRCGHKYLKLMVVAEIGQAFSKLLNITNSLVHFRDMSAEANWGRKLAQFRISFKDAYCGMSKEKMRLAHEMVATPKMTVAILRDYCRAFNLDRDVVMVAMLTELLLREQSFDFDVDRENSLSDQSTSPSCRGAPSFQMCSQAINEIQSKSLVLDTLMTVLEKVDDYNYEVLSFIMKNLEKVASILDRQDVIDSCQKGLGLLGFLKEYRRVGKSSELEQDLWQTRNIKMDSEDCIGSRLPFHALLGSDAWKIVCPELTISTIDVWLELAPVIVGPNVPRDVISDKMLMNAVRNIVPQVSDRIWADKARKGEISDSDTVEKIFSLIHRIKDPAAANASGSFVVHRLPPSHAKVMATEHAIDLAHIWSSTTDDKRAVDATKVFRSMHTKLLSEHILRTHGLEKAQYSALCDNPYQLIVALYHDPSVVDRFWFRSNKYPDIHDACKEIAAKNDCDLDEIFFNLLEKWLAPTACASPGLDETMTINMDFSTGIANQSGYNGNNSFVVDEDNLKRAVYLMKLGPERENAAHLTKWILSVTPGINYEHRFRATMCLLHSVSEDSIELCTGMTSEKVVKLAKAFFCASQMEMFRLPCDSVALDDTSRVQDLVVQLLQVSHRNPKALELAADLCVESKISAQKIWGTILQRMMDAKMYDELSKTLVSLPSLEGIAWLPVVWKSWRSVLEAPINVDDTLGIEKVILFHRCPLLSKLDLPSLSETFLQMGLYVLAMDCLLHIIDTQTRDHYLDTFLTPSVIMPLLKQLRELREPYGDLYHLDRVTNHLRSTLPKMALLQEITNSELFKWIVTI